MPNLPRISGREAIACLTRLGFKRARQKGSHVILKRVGPDGVVGCVVPMHKELAIGTLSGVLKQAKVTLEEFLEHL